MLFISISFLSLWRKIYSDAPLSSKLPTNTKFIEFEQLSRLMKCVQEFKNRTLEMLQVTKAFTQRRSIKIAIIKILQNSHEDTYAGFSFVIKKQD